MTSKNTKRALLTSALSILMCVSMLIGTTFAWFTDTATTNVNKIQAGTLDVALEMWDGEAWVNAEGQTLSFTDNYWEPGCTYELPKLRIVNKGNLALKYQVVITGIDGDAMLNEAIDWYYSVELTSFGGHGWTTLTDCYKLSNFTTGEKYLYPQAMATIVRPNESVFKIVGKMKETAGNKYQGLSIEGIAITVVATQAQYENDSKDNTYDAGAEFPDVWDGVSTSVPTEQNGVYHITTAAEFVGLMDQTQGGGASVFTGKKIVLDRDIDLAGHAIKGFGNESCIFGGSFDGQGHTVSNFKVDRAHKDDYAGLFNYYSYGTIENLIVKDATVIGVSKIGALAGNVDNGATVKNCVVENCTVIADRKVGGAIGYTNNATVTGVTVKNTSVYCATNEQAYGKNQWGEVIGYVNVGTTENGNTAINVAVKTGSIAVSTAAELAAALATGGNVVLTNDIDVNNAWLTAVVSNRSLTLDGNGHTIKNLNKPLLNLYGGTFKINNLTVESSVVSANDSQLGAGVIVEEAQWANLYMDNCHVKNCKLTGGDTRAAALVGYWVGGGEIKNSTVDNFTAFANGSVAGVVGHRAAQSGYVADAKITNCTVKNSNIRAQDYGWRIGTAIGTVAGNNTVITNFTESANTLEQLKNYFTAETNPNHSVYGRISGGSLTVDGTAQH